jgi:ABC-2 type transport system ATP-binding protein
MPSRSQVLAIEATGLTKQYGNRRAVDSLRLAVPQGTIFGFLGPNGAGKTTTIRMLLGLIRPSSGTAHIMGHDVQKEQELILPHIGAIVESPAFYPSFTAYENLEVLAITAGLDYPYRIDEVLEIVGLQGRGHEKVKTYSLGMKQRLAIAGALLNDPSILFLDEPTNGLDPSGTVEVRELIQRLGMQGHTIFISSHLLHEVEQICSDVAIINQGKLVTERRISSLHNQDAALLVNATPTSAILRVASQFGVKAEVKGDASVEVMLSHERVPALVKALVESGAEVYQVTPQHTSLEQYFLEVTADMNEKNNVVTPSSLVAATER